MAFVFDLFWEIEEIWPFKPMFQSGLVLLTMKAIIWELTAPLRIFVLSLCVLCFHRVIVVSYEISNGVAE